MQLTGPGSQYPPAPEAAARSKDDPQFFQGNLWLMEFGSLQVRIQADGAQGKGLLAVPIPAVAQRMLPMQRSLGLLLFALMTVLALALVSIVAAAVREGNLAPGALPTPMRKRRVPFAAAIASLVVDRSSYSWRACGGGPTRANTPATSIALPKWKRSSIPLAN